MAQKGFGNRPGKWGVFAAGQENRVFWKHEFERYWLFYLCGAACVMTQRLRRAHGWRAETPVRNGGGGCARSVPGCERACCAGNRGRTPGGSEHVHLAGDQSGRTDRRLQGRAAERLADDRRGFRRRSGIGSWEWPPQSRRRSILRNAWTILPPRRTEQAGGQQARAIKQAW